MPRFWVVGEPNADGSISKLSTEVATLARTLADAAGGEAVGVVVAAAPPTPAPSRPRSASERLTISFERADMIPLSDG